ncbi:C4-dicarboxylate transporter DcuC [Vibrio mediterranei]
MTTCLFVFMILFLFMRRQIVSLVFITIGIIVFILNGFEFQDIIEQYLVSFVTVFNTIGINILTVVAFSDYIGQNGSTKKLVSLCYKPISLINNPYLVLSTFYIFGLILSVIITSASALSMIFMSTVFPILVCKGVSKEAAASMISSIGVIEFGPLKSSTIFMAQENNQNLYHYVFNEQFVLFIGIAIIGAITHYFWQQHLDLKSKPMVEGKLDDLNAEYNRESKCSLLLAVLPLLPPLLIIFEYAFTSLKLPLWSIAIICLAITLIVDLYLRRHTFSKQVIVLSTSVVRSFFSIVSIIISGKFLVSSLPLETLFDNYVYVHLLNIGQVLFSSLLIISIVFSCIILGSGTVAFITIVSIISTLKLTLLGKFSSAFTSMQIISGIGRTVSPISPTTLLCSQMANISITKLIIRNSIPTMAIISLSIIYSSLGVLT